MSAKPATGCGDRDVREALAARLGCGCLGPLELGEHVVCGYDDEDIDDRSQKQEADGSIEEVAVLHNAAVDIEGECGEVGFADEGGDKRVDDVPNEGCHDGTEGYPDDDCDGEVEDIATKDKVSESLDHIFISLK